MSDKKNFENYKQEKPKNEDSSFLKHSLMKSDNSPRPTFEDTKEDKNKGDGKK